MADVKEISIVVPAEEAEALRTAVASGDYASTDEIMHEALRDWQDKRHAQTADATRLRRKWQEGLASGQPELLDLDAIKAKGQDILVRRRPGTDG
ncbi:ribbon-helix-helix domain-containing protein [Aurantimonas sp. A3-2-R12]|uniref:ribbon-helix-helix domain-containing protein n=1 Tax=Aurantimonas sp. A3-2-R12 TaxID=3114362 RepID=UPI002E18CFBD|nr:type II toxin-antitoxin system ParD family antitoxin [Aurantimonas sp. A3-2-R12]